MTVIDSGELDRRMGRFIDANSIPTHNGADQGAMQRDIEVQSDHLTSHQQTDIKGTSVFDAKELPSNQRYGSTTVISIKDGPPLAKEMEPGRPRAVPVGRPVLPPPPKPVHVSTPPRALHPLIQKAPVKTTLALPPVPAKPPAPPAATQLPAAPWKPQAPLPVAPKPPTNAFGLPLVPQAKPPVLAKVPPVVASISQLLARRRT